MSKPLQGDTRNSTARQQAMTAKHPGVVLLAREAATGSVEVAVLAHEPVLRRLDERVGEPYMHFPCAGFGFEPALAQDAAT